MKLIKSKTQQKKLDVLVVCGYAKDLTVNKLYNLSALNFSTYHESTMEASLSKGILITSHSEIKHLITNISQKRSAITLYPENNISYLTSFIDVADFHNGYMQLCSPQPEFRQPLLTKRNVTVTCRYQENIITIPKMELVTEENTGTSNFITSIPSSLYIYQRRSFIRQEFSTENPTKVELYSFNNVFSGLIKDLSFSGCRIVFPKDLSKYLFRSQEVDLKFFLGDACHFITKAEIKRVYYNAEHRNTQVGCLLLENTETQRQLIIDLIQPTYKNDHLQKVKLESSDPTNLVIKPLNPQDSTNINKTIGKKAYQNAINTVQSILNHFRLGKDIPFKQIADASKLLTEAILTDYQTIILFSRVRTTEMFHLQSTVSFAINLAYFLNTSITNLTKDILPNVITGCLLHNIPQLLSLAEHNDTLAQGDIAKHSILWHEHLRSYNHINSYALQIIENHLEFLDGSGIPSSKKAESLNIISRIASAIYQYEKRCHIIKNKACFYHPANNLNFSIEFKYKLDLSVLQKIKECYGTYPLGSTVLLKNNQLAMVISHNEKGSPSCLKTVYCLESSKPISPELIRLSVPDLNMIEGVCNPSFYNIQSLLINKFLNE